MDAQGANSGDREFQPVLGIAIEEHNLEVESKGKASRNCWTIHRLVGCLVMLKCRMRRPSRLITKKQ